MNLFTIFTDMKERIKAIPPDEPVFIYIGVGTYAGLKNKDGFLEPQNYHQYPPFIQDLKNSIPTLNLFIVLIDPMQEQPPYMIADKGLHLVNNDLHNNDLHNNDANKFATSHLPTTRTAGGIAIYSLLKSVYTDPYECYGDDFINITEELRDLNNYAIAENITLLYHDFTGRRNSLLADYFDDELSEHLNHIVYGMSARQDHGCYFDLSEPGSYFPWRNEGGNHKRACIILFNIYYYLVNNKTNLISSDYVCYVGSGPDPNIQIEQVITSVKSDLINHMLSLLRVIFRLIVGDEQRADINIDYCFNFIAKYHRQKFLNLYNDTNYIELYANLVDYFSRDVDRVAKLKNLDLTGKEILQFITYGDKPYEWCGNIKNHF